MILVENDDLTENKKRKFPFDYNLLDAKRLKLRKVSDNIDEDPEIKIGNLLIIPIELKISVQGMFKLSISFQD